MLIKSVIRGSLFPDMGAPLRPLARPAAKRVLDVEDVLRWAFRRELVGRDLETASAGTIPLPGYPSMSPMFRMASHGGRVDNWSHGSAPPGWTEPSPDALKVEAAVLSLAEYRDHRVGGAGLTPDMGFGIDETRTMARAMQNIVSLVMVNAKLAARPAWDGRCQPIPLISELNGKPVVRQLVTQVSPGAFGEVEETFEAPCRATRAGRYPQGAFCPLRYDPRPESVALDRAEYLAWWLGLDLVARKLEGGLEAIAVLAPSAPARPWAGETDLGKPPHLFGPEALPPAHVRQDRKHAAARRALRARRSLPRSPAAYPAPERCSNGNGCNGGAA